MLANRINRVTIRNFRSLEEVTVELGDLTVLVGPNGSGKSNFIDALHFISDALRRGLDATLNSRNRRSGMGAMRSATQKDQPFGAVEIDFGLTLNGQNSRYWLLLNSNENDEYRISKEECSVGVHFYKISDGHLTGLYPRQLDLKRMPVSQKNLMLPLVSGLPEFAPIYNFLIGTGFYSIFPDNLTYSQRSTNPYPLSEHGENLASVLRDFESEKYKDWRNDLFDSLASIVPGISKENPISVLSLGSNLVIKVKHENGHFSDLAWESDGTIRALALLVAIYQQPALSLLSIEEPEALIHPGAMGILCDTLAEAATRSQVILTTHSPDLIARFKADSLRIVELVNGSTKIGPLRDDQRQIIEEQLFNGGDLLRLGGLARG